MKERRTGGLFNQTPSNLSPQNYATKIFETNKKKTQKNQKTDDLEPDEGVTDLAIPGSPGDHITPLRDFGI